MTSFRNWSGSVECEPARIESPADEAALAELIARAQGEVRVVGAGHSGTPLCATEGLLLSLDSLAGVETRDHRGLVETVRAGTRLCDLGDPLLERGLAMQNLGDIDTQALAGAVGTGTHGTGRTLGNISSTVDVVRLVDAEGEIRQQFKKRFSDHQELTGQPVEAFRPIRLFPNRLDLLLQPVDLRERLSEWARHKEKTMALKVTDPAVR